MSMDVSWKIKMLLEIDACEDCIEFIVREGRGVMAKARSFANVTACRAVSNPAWYMMFREISCFSPLNIGIVSRCCVLGQGTLPSHASLDSGLSEYLVGQRWQCV